MAKRNVFSQIMRHISSTQFQQIVNRYEGNKGIRTLDCWTWLGGLVFGQLTGHCSVRGICKAFQVHREGLKTLGFSEIRKSTFADANEKREVGILKDTFYSLLDKAHALAPRSKFKFKGKVMAMDSTTISLCLELSPWARFHHGKGGVKLHTAVDLAGDVPQFGVITPGKVHDMTAVRSRYFAPGTTLVIDRGYVDYGWFNRLDEDGVFFVTRMKRKCKYRIAGRRRTNRTQGVMCDQTIELTSQKGKVYKGRLRKVSYRDPDTGKRYVFLTNRFDLSPQTIADIYKARWQIELFFKTLKGQLRITKFIGRSENSVRAQLWSALIVYVLIAITRFCARIGWSTPEMMAVIGVMLLVRQDLMSLLKDAPLQRVRSPVDVQMSIF